MEVLRTPDEYFDALTGYPYSPKYVTLAEHDELRMHYVDEGPKDGRAVLMLHGEPTWSYLYRHMIPIFAEAAYRPVAPDLIGFGRSDKPAAREDYTYQRHVDWMRAFLDALKLSKIVLVCQDWGGLIGLRLVAEEPERFDAVIAANTFLPTGREPLPEAFFRWREMSQSVEELPIGPIVQRGTERELHEEILAAYEAPFPEESFKAGARQFPAIVPADPDDPEAVVNRALWEKLAAYDRPFVTAFSDRDPITRGADAWLQDAIVGAKGMPHTTLGGAGHFLQEDRGPELAWLVLRVANAL